MAQIPAQSRSLPNDVWKAYTMAIEGITDRLERITRALSEAGVEYAIIGGQAVALWVATVDPAAVRTTKDVDLLLNRHDLPLAREAARRVEMDYFEILNVGMFLDRADMNPRHAVHLVWANEMVRPEESLPAPSLEGRHFLPGGKAVISLENLIEMKLTAYREQDRVHLRDLIAVGLLHPDSMRKLPPELEARLAELFAS